MSALRKKSVKPITVEIEVSYLAYPSERARQEAYETHAALFLKAKERMLKGIVPGDKESPRRRPRPKSLPKSA